MKALAVVLTCNLFVTSVYAHADFTYQESTQITGGSVMSMMKLAGTFSRQARQAGDPILTSVMVKGNRMIRNSKDHSEIIDLDAGTITEINHLKKQYTTMTFEEMRQQMEAAAAKARAEQAKQPKQQQPPPSADASQVDIKFKVKVRPTGVSRDVAGLSAKESILTLNADARDQKSGQTGSLAMTNDMYLAPEIPGYEEVRDFEKRYALKLGTVINPALSPQMLAMMQPGSTKGMADMVEEMSKLKGIPVLQIMRMGSTVDGSVLPAASEAELPAGPAMPSAGEIAKQSASAAIMNSIPFGGFGRKKKQEEPAPAANAPQQNWMVLIEMSTQMTNFSKASIDPGQFRPPAGYQQVPPTQMN